MLQLSTEEQAWRWALRRVWLVWRHHPLTAALWTLLGAQVVLGVLEIVIAATHATECNLFTCQGFFDYWNNGFELFPYLINRRMLFFLPGYIVCWVIRFYRIVFCSSAPPGQAIRWQHDWTAVSSKDIYLETAHLIKAAHTHSFLYCVLTTAVLTAAHLPMCPHSHKSGPRSCFAHGDHEDDSTLVMNLRLTACRSYDILPVIYLTVQAFLCSVTLFIPMRMWSEASREAVQLVDDMRIKRLLSFHIPALPAVLLTSALSIMRFRWQKYGVVETECLAFLFSGILLVVYQVSLSIWGLGLSWHTPQDTVEKVAVVRQRVSQSVRTTINGASSLSRLSRMSLGAKTNRTTMDGASRRQSVESARDHRPPGERPLMLHPVPFKRPENVHRLSSVRALDRLKSTLGGGADISRMSVVVPPVHTTSMTEVHSLLSTKEAGVEHRQRVLITFAALALAVGSFGHHWGFTVLLYLYRGFLFLMLLLSKDHVVKQFTDLRQLGVGFGLVADAKQLRRALSAYLHNRSCTGTLPMYKASLFRMGRTMALSYRWQEEEAHVCDGLSLNMSRWQMQSLHDALCNSTALYVWIDRVSVPQKKVRSATQKTLLSRMMAVYSSAQATLCLRSIEHDGSRYHQRAWTLQEYCAANSLIMATELCGCGGGDPDCASCAGQLAVAGDEAQFFQGFREQQLLKRQLCRPFWIYGTCSPMMTVEQAIQIVDCYYELQNRVYCQQDADKIRSLYPMLSNIPVESHTDLHRLITMVSRNVQTVWTVVKSTETNLDLDLHRYVAHARRSMMCLDEETPTDIAPTGLPASLTPSRAGSKALFATLPMLKSLRAFKSATLPEPNPTEPLSFSLSTGNFQSPPTAFASADISGSIRDLMDRNRSLRNFPASTLVIPGERKMLAERKMPADVRLMESLMSPNLESGWSTRKGSIENLTQPLQRLAVSPSVERSCVSSTAYVMRPMSQLAPLQDDLFSQARTISSLRPTPEDSSLKNTSGLHTSMSSSRSIDNQRPLVGGLTSALSGAPHWLDFVPPGQLPSASPALVQSPSTRSE